MIPLTVALLFPIRVAITPELPKPALVVESRPATRVALGFTRNPVPKPIVPAITPAPKPKPPEPPFDMAAEETRLVRVAVDGGSAQRVVAALLLQTRINLVLLGAKSSPVSLKLTDVPLIEAVRHLCATSGLSFLRLPRTLVLGPEESLKAAYPEAWREQYPPVAPVAAVAPVVAPIPVTQVIKLSHVSAASAAAALKPIFDSHGVMAVAAPAVVSPSLGAIETGVMGSSSNAGKGGASGEDPLASRTLVLTGPAEEVARAAELVARLDVPRAQVRVDVTMHDINDSALKDLGISWSFGPIDIKERSDRSFLFGRFDRAGFSASAVIKALEQKDAARLLASPNITVQDGDRGFVLIGDRLNYPVLIGYSQANTPIFDIKTERVGIYLQVAASVAEDGTVTMTLAPQVSTVSSYREVNGASYPQISTREAQSTIRVKSGEPIIMGGLIRDEEIRSMERVPILGDLPFLGELFRRRKTQRSSSQLVITVTPTVIKP